LSSWTDSEVARLTTAVVSLVPSVTETLLAWGIRPAAVTRFCEAPGIPTVGGTKNPDVESIVALGPDLVVMDAEENRIEDAGALQAAGVRIHATHVRSFDGVEPMMADLWAAVGGKGQHPASSPRPAARRPAAVGLSAWVPIWRRPWISLGGGTYGSSLLSEAGIRNVLDEPGAAYPKLGLEEASALQPDYVLAPSEPYPFSERHRGELEEVAPVVLVDGRDLFWWGDRTAGALNRLTELAGTLVPR
jgi:ABC-type Fe3+-hydroxamate transport system substrate-binding protein